MNPNQLYGDIRSEMDRRYGPDMAARVADVAMNVISRNTRGFRDLEPQRNSYTAPIQPTVPSAEQIVKNAAEALANAEAALAAKNAHTARIELIESDYNLAGATQTLMTCIKSLVNGGSTTQDLEVLAKYRKELQPLAERHGFKIVLVGNKTKATVVQA